MSDEQVAPESAPALSPTDAAEVAASAPASEAEAPAAPAPDPEPPAAPTPDPEPPAAEEEVATRHSKRTAG